MSTIHQYATTPNPSSPIGVASTGHPGTPDRIGPKPDYVTGEAAEFTIAGAFGTDAKAEALGTVFSEALQSVRSMRAALLADSVAVAPESNTFTFSQIRDNDVANETINTTKSQILSQPANSPLARTSHTDQSFLSLIK
ncbi:MAG: hypothetical protein FWG12_01420 [Holophagaceae bacterium]|nr:hypothetical protein [Holophagaceae bacterium]